MGHIAVPMSSASGRPAPPAAAVVDPLLGYPLPPDADVYDEMLSAPGAPRAHWRTFADSLAVLGPAELARRWEQARGSRSRRSGQKHHSTDNQQPEQIQA